MTVLSARHAAPAAPSRQAERVADPDARSFFRGSTVLVRLALAFCAIGSMSLFSTLLAGWQLDQVQQHAEAALRVERLAGVLHAQAAANVARVTALAHSTEPAVRQALAPGLAAAQQGAAELHQQLEPLLQGSAAAALLRDAAAGRTPAFAGVGGDGQAWLAAAEAYAAATRKLLDDGDGDGARALAGRARSASHELLYLYAVLCALTIPFVWFLLAHILRPLSVAVRIARKVADGDLTVKVRTGGSDELARLMLALDDMTASLRRIVSDVVRGASAVAATGAQVRESHVDLADRTEQQATTLEQTASSMEELTATVAQNAGNAREASALAMDAARVAERGGDVVSRVVSSMGGISDSARHIEDISAVIDALAFQTNLLALNAAVEAARAGEQGRGFAVVAAEVRNLAQRSAAAAREIKGLISESVRRVEDGAKLADAAGGTMGEIVACVRRVSDLVAEIAAASDQQRAGIEQVNIAIASMDRVVQQNAALVEQTGTSTDALQDQSRALLQAVAQFKLKDGRGPSGVPAGAGPADRGAWAPAPVALAWE